MFKPQDKVKFGQMIGYVVTTVSTNPDIPIQALFPKQRMVLGFKENGDFFPFPDGPKLVKVRMNILEFIRKGASYVRNMLRSKSTVDSNKPQS